ncbi:MAG TPA: dihydropteroate synthase [Succinivibrionaceae bacterium]|nr:dihydropteroate synthase [Succinivibrionaceae bacterium]
MGILNVTPDSFSDGGSYQTEDRALFHVEEMVKAGADIIDIGGESTRPDAALVSEEEELSRVIRTVELTARNFDVLISVDTSKPKVIREAFASGAHIWNDIRSLDEEGALETASELALPVILMHMQGTPQNMQHNPVYSDVVSEVMEFLKTRTEQCIKAGIKKENIIWDPGFGFGKTVDNNYSLLKHFDSFTHEGHLVVSALSRKSMIGAATKVETPRDRVSGSVAGALISAQKGAAIVRVHDVKETVDALRVLELCQNAD